MKTCNLCRGNQLKPLIKAIKVSPVRHWMSYLQCRDCGLVTLDLDYDKWLSSYEISFNHADTAQQKRAFYQATAETWASINAVNNDTGRSLYESITDGKGRLFIDIGAGWGSALSVFESMGWQVCGLEPGKPQCQFATENNFAVVNQYYTQDSYASNFADFIYCYHVLEHIPTPFEAILNFNRHLKHGGMLYLEVPNAARIQHGHLGFGHITLFTPTVLEGALQLAGFSIQYRNDRGTAGYGVFARKEQQLLSCGFDESHTYVPQERVNWKPDNYWRLRLGLHHAFHLYSQDQALLPRLPKLLAKEARECVRRWRQPQLNEQVALPEQPQTTGDSQQALPQEAVLSKK